MVGSLNRIKITLDRQDLQADERVVLEELLKAGYGQNGSPLGRDSALTANELALQAIYPLMYGDGDPAGAEDELERMETCKRRLRKVINQLVIGYGIPICCEPGYGGGYYLPANEEEVEANHARFHARAMTGLVKASRARKGAYADAIIQLTLGFETGAAKLRERLNIRRVEDSGPPPWVSVVTGLLQEVKDDPERYAAEIRQIQSEFGDIFVRRDKVQKMRQLSSELREVLEGIGGV